MKIVFFCSKIVKPEGQLFVSITSIPLFLSFVVTWNKSAPAQRKCSGFFFKTSFNFSLNSFGLCGGFFFQIIKKTTDISRENFHFVAESKMFFLLLKFKLGNWFWIFRILLKLETHSSKEKSKTTTIKSDAKSQKICCNFALSMIERKDPYWPEAGGWRRQYLNYIAITKTKNSP